MPRNVITGERDGAQVFVARCMEPSTNTPGAQRRIVAFIHPVLERAGIEVDQGTKGRPRWLLDRVQSAGTVRLYAEGDPIEMPWLERNLRLAISAHKPELVVLMDHMNCGERRVHWRAVHGRFPTLEEEVANIIFSLRGAERRFRYWEESHREVDAPPVHVLLAVGLVTPNHEARFRRMNRVVSLDEFERMGLPTITSESLHPVVTARTEEHTTLHS